MSKPYLHIFIAGLGVGSLLAPVLIASFGELWPYALGCLFFGGVLMLAFQPSGRPRKAE